MPNMELRELLLKKEQELEKLVQMAEKHIDSPLSGTLHICIRRNPVAAFAAVSGHGAERVAGVLGV